MKTGTILTIATTLMLGLSGCHADHCTVKGTVKGIRDGARLELQDAWDHYKVIGTARIKDGTFRFHQRIKAPSHVYLYTIRYRDGGQLKDFILEPGTVLVDVDATNLDSTMYTGATGTVLNDIIRRFREFQSSGDVEASEALVDEILGAEQTGPLALYLADMEDIPTAQATDALNRLSPALAVKKRTLELRDELKRRARTEPAAEGSGSKHLFIDMKYSDAEGNLVSLSSVVNDPANRYVLLHIWVAWRPWCSDYLPDLKAAYDKYHEKGLEIYSVSLDSDIKLWKSSVAKNGMTWPNVLSIAANRKSKVWYDYALKNIPCEVLIDGETGEILARDTHLDLDTILAGLLP